MTTKTTPEVLKNWSFLGGLLRDGPGGFDCLRCGVGDDGGGGMIMTGMMMTSSASPSSAAGVLPFLLPGLCPGVGGGGGSSSLSPFSAAILSKSLQQSRDPVLVLVCLDVLCSALRRIISFANDVTLAVREVDSMEDKAAEFECVNESAVVEGGWEEEWVSRVVTAACRRLPNLGILLSLRARWDPYDPSVREEKEKEEEGGEKGGREEEQRRRQKGVMLNERLIVSVTLHRTLQLYTSAFPSMIRSSSFDWGRILPDVTAAAWSHLDNENEDLGARKNSASPALGDVHLFGVLRTALDVSSCLDKVRLFQRSGHVNSNIVKWHKLY